MKLLQVKGRKAYLTDAGHLLLRRAEGLLDSAQHIDDLARSLSAGEEPEIGLAIDQIMPAVYITEVLEQFASEYPNTRVQLYETVLSGAREALEEGAVDLAIAGAGMAGYLSEPMTGIDFIAVASVNHELCNMGPLNMDDLRNHRQIVTRDSALQDKVDSGWLKAEQRWTVSNLSTAVAMVQRG
ncbi:LysR substrate-binding domain-containing protein [Aliamphritea spongicola]|nr:LysR substrate-binding domain-containing protein [Aliamphritea spongicola]